MAMQVETITLTSAKPASSQMKPHAPVADLVNVSVTRTKAALDTERRNAMIAEAAYYRAERRGFESGFELEDWLEAEAEIDGKFKDGEIPLACGI